MSATNEGTPVLQVLGAIARTTERKKTTRLMNMDFPTLDEMEMDVPLPYFNMPEARLSPEDDEELEMQYMQQFAPEVTHSMAR